MSYGWNESGCLLFYCATHQLVVVSFSNTCFSVKFKMSTRKSISFSDKIRNLNEINKGVKKKDVAQLFKISASTLSTILKNRQTIDENESNFGPKQKRMRLCQYDDLDKAMLKWIRGIRDRNCPVSGTLLQEKAMEFAKILGYSDFKASAGWMDKFKKRHGLTLKTICGESADVPEEVCDSWMEKIPEILQEFSPQNIFNADETGLFFKCLPTKTLAFKGDKCLGGKKK